MLSRKQELPVRSEQQMHRYWVQFCETENPMLQTWINMTSKTTRVHESSQGWAASKSFSYTCLAVKSSTWCSAKKIQWEVDLEITINMRTQNVSCVTMEGFSTIVCVFKVQKLWLKLFTYEIDRSPCQEWTLH